MHAVFLADRWLYLILVINTFFMFLFFTQFGGNTYNY